MRWQDEGMLLAVARHGENSARLAVFTRQRGVWHGLVRASRKSAALPQIGVRLRVDWTARLESHLGLFKIEALNAMPARLYDAPLGLLALQSLCTLLATMLAEREPLPDFYRDCSDVSDSLDAKSDWLADYVRWETRLLAACGFGLDLSKCHAGGEGALDFLSPRTGRALSAGAAKSPVLAPYRERLLPLPAFLRDEAERNPTPEALCEGLTSTGFFLAKFLTPLPPARVRLLEALRTRGKRNAQGNEKR